MFNFFKRNKTNNDYIPTGAVPTFSLERTPSGKFAIVHSTDGVVASYTRKADAVRGADRKGITLANV